MADVLAGGLTHVLEDTPVRTVYLRATAGADQAMGPYAQVEAGLHPWDPLGVFAFGRDDEHGWSAGIGAELRGRW